MTIPNNVVYIIVENPLLYEVLLNTGKFIPDPRDSIFLLTTIQEAAHYGYPTCLPAMSSDQKHYWIEMHKKEYLKTYKT